MHLRFFVAVVALGLLAGPRPSVQQPAPGSWWVMAGGRTVVLDEAYNRRGAVEVGQHALDPVSSPDGRTIAVAAAGAYKPHRTFSGVWEYWPEPGASSSVTLVKADSLEVLARPTIRFMPSIVRFTTDGRRLVVVSDGQVSKNAEKQILPAVTFIDTGDGKVVKEIDLDSEPVRYRWHPDRGLLIAVCAGFDKRAPSLALIDTAGMSIKQIPLPGRPLGLWPGLKGELDYVNLENEVVPLGPDGVMLAPISAGKEKLFVVPLPDLKRLLLSGRSGKDGQLLVIEGGRGTKAIPGPAATNLVFSSDGTRVVVCGNKMARVMDVASLDEIGRFEIPGTILDVVLDPSDRFLYVHEGDKVSVVSVADGKQVGRFSVGSGWRKFSTAMSSQGYWVRLGGTVGDATGSRSSKATAIDTMAFSPSGKHVFVFNSEAKDISIVDTTTFTSVSKVGVGDVAQRDFFWRMPGGKHLLALNNNRAIVFDTEAAKVAADRKFDDSVVRIVPSMAMLLVRTAGGTTMYRASPFEAAFDFGPECALGQQALHDNESGFVADSDTRRFVLSSAKGVRLYDFDLKLLAEIQGLGLPTKLCFVETPTPDAK